MEFIKNVSNTTSELGIPITTYIPPQGENGDMAIWKGNGIYDFSTKANGTLYLSEIVSSGSGKLYRSFDDGKTWDNGQNPQTGYSTTIYIGRQRKAAFNDALLSVGQSGNEYLRYSINNGVSWSISKMKSSGENIVGGCSSKNAAVYAGSDPKWVAVGSWKSESSTTYQEGFLYTADMMNDGIAYFTFVAKPSNWTTKGAKLYYSNGIWLAYTENSSGPGIVRSADGINWTKVSSLVTRSILHANGIWIAGTSAGIYYSNDEGVTWTQSNITTDDWFSISYGNGMFHATSGNSKGIKYSTNGTTWSGTNITSNSTYQVVYGNDIWVSCGYNSGWRYSTDGKTFTSSNITSGSPINIVFTGDRFISAKGDGIFYSTDGKTWTVSNKTSLPTNNVSLAYKNDKVLVAATGQGLKYSRDNGNTFIGSNISATAYAASYANGVYIAGSLSGNAGIYYSNDGMTFAASNITNMNISASPVYGNGTWIARVGSGMYYSTDNGKTWTVCPNMSNTSLYFQTFANGVFIGCSTTTTGQGKGIYRSTDGINWTKVWSNAGAMIANYADGTWLAATQDSDSTSSIYAIQYSTDNGLTWSPSNNCDYSSNTFYFRKMVYAKGIWVAPVASGFTGCRFSKNNGITWQVCHRDGANFNSGNFTDIVYFKGLFITCGRAGSSPYDDGIFYSSDGNNFTFVELAPDNQPTGLQIVGDKLIAIVNAGANTIYETWDGIHWYKNPNMLTQSFRLYPFAYRYGDWKKVINFQSDKRGFVGEVKPSINTIQDDNWLLCDGSTFDTTKYSALYNLLGTNKVPDFREVIPVAIGTNGLATAPITNFPQGHDVFTLGQIKDRQIGEHTHSVTESASHTHGVTKNGSHTHTYQATARQIGTTYEDSNATSAVYQSVGSGVNVAWEQGIPNITTADATVFDNPPAARTYGTGLFHVKSYGVNYYIRGK